MRLELDQLTPRQYRQHLLNEVKTGKRPKSTLECVHVRWEYKDYDQKTGARISKPMLTVYSQREWGFEPSQGAQDYLRATGAEYTILFDPNAKDDPIVNDSPIEADDEEEAKESPKARGRREKKGE